VSATPGLAWRISAYWPGGVRHAGDASPVCGFRTEQEKARPDTGRSRFPGPSDREHPERLNRKGLNRKGLSTVAGRAGGPVRSSGEVPVTGGERRGRGVRGLIRSISAKGSGRNRMDELEAPGKPFAISKQADWEAWEKVRASKGAPGVDAVTIAEFESDLKNNLYKIWTRLSSGPCFPPPVRAVEIPKPHGGGTRIPGVSAVADRVAQTVVAGVIEAKAAQVFHPDSHGCRPGRSALDAVAACRHRCWENDWVIDLDIRKFFDTMPWHLAVKAIQAVTDLPWVVLYVRRWLAAPLALPDGTLQQRDRGTPQGSFVEASKKDPYEQCLFMRSAGRLTLVGGVAAAGRCA